MPDPSAPTDPVVLATWHSRNGGLNVLAHALRLLAAERVPIDRVLYLHRDAAEAPLPEVERTAVEGLRVDVADPTDHEALYGTLRAALPERLASARTVHVNVSPGTPAMHAVWLVLRAGGTLHPDLRLWATQKTGPAPGDVDLRPVRFSPTTYLQEVQRERRARAREATYDPEPLSAARRAALDQLALYGRVPHAPLLVLGERGTGKTRLVETYVAPLRGRSPVVTVPCGALDSALADSILFGHVKGAFSGAVADRPGLVREAEGRLLFLDEVQDLPRPVQRKLVRFLQDHHHRYRPRRRRRRADGRRGRGVRLEPPPGPPRRGPRRRPPRPPSGCSPSPSPPSATAAPTSWPTGGGCGPRRAATSSRRPRRRSCARRSVPTRSRATSAISQRLAYLTLAHGHRPDGYVPGLPRADRRAPGVARAARRHTPDARGPHCYVQG